MKEGRLSVEGATIPYYFLGEGPNVLTLVNGYSRPSSDFRMFAKRLSEKGIRCLFFDNRGAGDAIVNRPFRLRDMVSDIKSLWDELEIDNSALLGISMGGMIAQQFAVIYDDLSRLILVSTSPRALANAADELPWSSDPEQVRQKMMPYFSESFRVRNKLVIDAMVKQIAKKVETTDFIERAAMQKAAMSEFDVLDDLPGISCPTLVIHGRDDRIVPVEAAEEIAEAIPTAQMHLFSDCGHLLLAERPQEFATIVADFLQKS